MTEPTALYWHYNSNRDLLYIGISLNPIYRLSGHKRSKWFKEIVHIDIVWYKTRALAKKAEDKYIRKERPKYNLMKNVTQTRPQTATYRKKIENTSEAVVYNKLLSIINDAGGTRKAAKMLGFSAAFVSAVANGMYPISEKLAKAMGYELQAVYVPAKKESAP